MGKLTTKQQRFIEAYAGNSTDAARIAGYKGDSNTLAVTGSRLLKHPAVRAALEKRFIEKREKLIADREELQAGWTEIFRDKEGEATRDRLKSGELLGKSQGVFVDRFEFRGTIASLSTPELISLIENKAKALGLDLDTKSLKALPDLDRQDNE